MEQEILKDLKCNVLKWYEFKKNSEIMYIGENQELIVYLKKYNKINVVQKTDEVKENKSIALFIPSTFLICTAIPSLEPE